MSADGIREALDALSTPQTAAVLASMDAKQEAAALAAMSPRSRSAALSYSPQAKVAELRAQKARLEARLARAEARLALHGLRSGSQPLPDGAIAADSSEADRLWVGCQLCDFIPVDQTRFFSAASFAALTGASDEGEGYAQIVATLPRIDLPPGTAPADPAGSTHWLPGLLDLRVMSQCLEHAGLRAEPVGALDCAEAGGAFREALGRLGEAGVRLAVNFDRKQLGQQGDGHWSPVGGYNGAEDMLLVPQPLDRAEGVRVEGQLRDTAPCRGDYWLPVPLMLEAMATQNR